jgi:hypothetical protein
MQEKRASRRYQTLIAGKLIAPEMRSVADVTIRDMSEGGALVASASMLTVPDRVYLWEAASGTLLECEVRWQKFGRLFGLRFSDQLSSARRHDLVQTARVSALVPLTRSPRPVASHAPSMRA